MTKVSRTFMSMVAAIAVSTLAQSPTPAHDAKSQIDSLSAADLQQAISALRSNFVSPDSLNEQALNRATLQGLMSRLGRDAIIIAPASDGAAQPAESTAFSELLDNHIGYLRVGSLTNTNLQAIDKFLANFSAKKVDAVIVDLRVDAPSSDFSTAAEFAKRFAPKGKPLFTLHKASARQDRTFTSERDPAFQGTVMVLADAETSGAAEALAGALRSSNKALVIGGNTAGRAVEYSEVALSENRTLRIASSQVLTPDGRSLFPEGVKPDIAVEMSASDKRQIFQASAQKGMASFVFEAERPHLNEAALIAGTNPELEESAQRRARNREPSSLRDSVLQRAVDVVTSLAIYQKR